MTFTNTAGSLGDWLSLTPLLRAFPGSTVVAKDAPHTRAFATLYEGLATVEFTTDEIAPTSEAGEGPFARRILNGYGVSGPAIPSIEIRADEIEWAKSFLSQYESPVAFTNTCGGADPTKPDNDVSNWRKMPVAVAQWVIKDIKSKGQTPLRFGASTYQGRPVVRDTLDGVIDIPDLTLRQVAACYAVMGEGYLTDTGDKHLMLAVGGIVHCFVPPSMPHYDHGRHLYMGDCWGNQPVRVRYYGFNK